MNQLWYLMWFVIGFAAAVPLTYLWTVHHKRLNSFEETMRAEKAESFQQGKEAAARDITFEQTVSTSRRGIIWKSTYKVISERALLNGIPITPFYEYAVQMDEGLDARELGHVADAVRMTMGLPALTELGLKTLPKKAAKELV